MVVLVMSGSWNMSRAQLGDSCGKVQSRLTYAMGRELCRYSVGSVWQLDRVTCTAAQQMCEFETRAPPMNEQCHN